MTSRWGHWSQLREQSVNGRVEEKKVRPLTPNQEVYWKTIVQRALTICTGPCGSGKSLLAACIGGDFLSRGLVKKLVLCRPLTSCGEPFGWLPGDVDEKVLPYMRPLLDILVDTMGAEEVEKRRREGSIVMSPLELLRGTTFKHSFVLLSESQNASYAQLRLLLTRIGQDTKVVVEGDASQSDLPPSYYKGKAIGNPLEEVIRRLEGHTHKDVGVVRLGREDILRSELVGWLEDRLEGEKDEVQGPWRDFLCPVCQSSCWFRDGVWVDVSVVSCWSCKAVLHLPDDLDDVGKDCVDERPDFPLRLAQKTFPKRT